MLVAGLSSVALHAQDQPKKYDVKLDWKAVEGHKSELAFDDSQLVRMVISTNDREIMKREDKQSRSFAAVEVIVKTKDDKPAVSRWTFSKATQQSSDRNTPFAFQGRTVVVTKDPGRGRLFAFDNGEAVAPEDAAVLAQLWGSDNKPGELSGEEIFAPKQPVSVGETWTPDVATIARELKFGDVDVKRSSAKATLKSAETRNGVEFGKVELQFELWLTKFGPMQLEKPAVMKAAGDIDACLDRTLPDGTMRMTMEAKADGPATMGEPPTRVQVSFEMKANMLEIQTTAR